MGKDREASVTSAPLTYGFDPARFYSPGDDALRRIATPEKLRQWRHYGRGLPYLKIGGSIFYAGADVIAHLNEQRVEPRRKRAPAGAAATADSGAPA